MDKTEKIQSILKAVEQEVNQWVNEEENIRDPILYEQKLLEMAFNFGKTLMLSSQGKVPKDRNVKKKVLTCFGKVELKKIHPLSQGTSRFKVSMALQELICLFAQSSVFEDVSDLLEKVFPISISNKQIQRVSEWYGDQLNPIIEANQEEFIPQLPKMKQPEQTTYVMVDGSMINTIGEKWKEIKLGRVFHQDSNVEISPGRKEIQHSVYVSHLGSIDEFFPKFERHLTGYRNKVFICDGAKWIWNWVDSNYPGATQILDFYHATEKLELFARNHFIKKEKKEEWLVRQKSLLMTDQVLTVIENIQSLKPRNKEARETKEKVIQYYIEHEDRMMYQSAKNRGLLIGSGPIEAAHRKVIHQRLKLSGQKWSIKGANAIANLRCYKASNAWPLIINLIKLAA